MTTMHDMPVLVVYEGEPVGQRWIVDQDVMTIGRGDDCDISIPLRQVSRCHARIERCADGYVLHDLGSKNGTFVNGEEVRGDPHLLRDGDEIQIALCVRMGFVGADATLPLDLTGIEKGLQVDRAARKVFVAGQEVTPPLSVAQYALLDLLLSREGRVVTRDEIVNSVWADEEAVGVSEQAIDALVRRLRERLADADPTHVYVVTVRGHGFRFDNR
jgi:hypothetical protein